MERNTESARQRQKIRRIGIVLTVVFIPWFLLWSYEGIVVALGQKNVLNNLVTTSATLTDLGTIEGKASAQDGGYVYTAACTATVLLNGQSRTVQIPCIAYTQFSEGHTVKVTTWHNEIVEIADEGDPFPVIRNWDAGIRVLFIILMFPIMLTGILMVIAQTAALASQPRQFNTAGPVVLGAVLGYGVAIYLAIVPGFTHNLANPWWPVWAVTIAVAATSSALALRRWLTTSP